MNKNSKIGIVGGGIEGLAVVQYLKKHGFKNLNLFDEKEEAGKNLPKDMNFFWGDKYLSKLNECEIVFRSPGVKPSLIKGVKKVTSTTQFFLEKCPCKVIGVTGTKGKGTTSTLIYLILKEAGFDVYLGGNIGQSPLEFLDKLNKNSVVVLELSSFQLQDVSISPHIAVVLHVGSEHLDYHKNVREYLEAKLPIVRFQTNKDFCIVNKDYKESAIFLAKTVARKYFVSTRKVAKEGAFIKDEKIFFGSNLIGETAKVGLLGQHNLENILPAVTVGKILRVPKQIIQKVIYSFKGLPHRLEFVREIKGIKFYNDSFSTTPETSIAAVNAFKSPVILIAGGSDKGASYKKWGAILSENKNLKMVILIGLMADKMANALDKVKIVRAKSLEDAVKFAYKNAGNGDTVLLSPAAASFDMFKNYKERGEIFRKAVKLLTL